VRTDGQFRAGSGQINGGAFQQRRAIAEIDPGRAIHLGPRRRRLLFHDRSSDALACILAL
jgi:hypothetical protein